MEEQWKPIKDFEDLYQISNLGRVKSLNYLKTEKTKIMTPTICTVGYPQVDLRKKNKRKGDY